MQDPLASWAAILAASATFVLALFAFFSMRIARKTLDLMQAQETKKKPSLTLYRVDNKYHRYSTLRIFDIKLRVNNIASSSNSITDVALQVVYKKSDIETQVIIPLWSGDITTLDGVSGIDKEELFYVPMVLDPQNSVIKRALFKIDDSFFQNATILSYKLIVKDVFNSEYQDAIHVMNVSV